jgi:hypothetical protein
MLWLITTPYWAHSRAPWFHSWYNPIIRISRNADLIVIYVFIFDVVITIVIGRSRAISTSKIRKITAIRKNRSKNGRRADLFGSNPHSNGDLFSRSSMVFLDSSDVNIMTAVVSANVVIAIVIVIIITYHL